MVQTNKIMVFTVNNPFSRNGWNMIGKLFALSSIFIILSCAGENEDVKASFEVDGMIVRNGFLWLGWPTNVGKALDGLKDVSKHTFDSETWIFTVSYNKGKLKRDEIMQVVEAAEEGFKVKNWKLVKFE